MVKVQRFDVGDTEPKELSLEKVQRLIAEVQAQNGLVLDRRTGHAIKKITSDVEEIIIVGPLMEGG
jgi:hypothetical protein